MNIYLQYIITGSAVAGFLGIASSQFIKGGRTGFADQINFYKGETANYKDMMEKKDAAHIVQIAEIRKEYNDKYENMMKEFGIMQSQYNTEKALRERYEAIAKDKNPETEKFREFMMKAVENQDNVNKEIVNVLKEIFIMAKAEHDREFNIHATVS